MKKVMQQTIAPRLAQGETENGRRQFIKQSLLAGAGLALGAFGAPAVLAGERQQVIVRGLGGAYQEAMEKAIYQPFTAATGIEVKVQPATAAQVLAMVRAGRVNIDVLDLLDVAQISLDKAGALAPIDYQSMTLTHPDDIRASVRHPNMVGNLFFATVLTYNTKAFSQDNHPKGWAEFWDLKRFPGPRTLADQRSGAAELELALLADGVPVNGLYPIDLDRAFASLSRIKPAVAKWWDTGAVSAQLLERRDAVLGAIWNGRAQALIDQGAPLAIDWNQAKQQVQYWSVVKNAPNARNAQRFIDFALQPSVQAALTRYIAYGPTNTRAFDLVRPEDLAKLPGSPAHFDVSFQQDAQWWADNVSRVGEKWQAWVLGSS
ncbi:ABC transporter substrate-binding protein [Erwinia typographi]|uniref:ABC transporter substrate-binding protein n=1 Tax=Erwinia typographi TaxID=371042 RepID=UPI0009FC9C3C|nr:ABC transporter substrate-binding protein [Erwinia typographi]